MIIFGTFIVTMIIQVSGDKFQNAECEFCFCNVQEVLYACPIECCSQESKNGNENHPGINNYYADKEWLRMTMLTLAISLLLIVCYFYKIISKRISDRRNIVRDTNSVRESSSLSRSTDDPPSYDEVCDTKNNPTHRILMHSISDREEPDVLNGLGVNKTSVHDQPPSYEESR